MTEKEIAAKEAALKIEALIQQSKDVIVEAMKIADEHGIDFSYEPDRIGTYYGKGSDADGRYEEGEGTEGEWYPSSWSSSSIYC